MADEVAGEVGVDIYAVLELCTAEELAPTVDALAKAKASFLKFTRAYERHHPHHERYTDQIGDETYRLGAIATGIGDGGRSSYHALVLALCRHIGFALPSQDLEAGEALLLNAFAKRHLSSVPPGDRASLAVDAADAAALAARGIFTSEAWPPLAFVLMQVAFLRRKLDEDRRLRPATAAIPSACAAASGDLDGSSDAVSVRLHGGELLLSPAVDVAPDGWTAIGASPGLDGALAPILKAIQPLMAVGQTLRADELLRRLPDGVDGVAHIVETGRKGMGTLGSVPLAGLMGPMAMMALAAAMAEQRKLEAIERSLADIRNAVADVSIFQREERRSVLTGSIRYFRQVAPAVLTGELAAEVLQEVERHEVDLVRIQEHLAAELRERMAAMRSVRKETFGSSKYLKALQEAQAALRAKYDEFLLCLRARACGYQLLCAYPGREAGKKVRSTDIVDALDTVSPMGETAVAMDAVLRDKIAACSYDTRTAFIVDENRLLDRIAAARTEILEGLATARPASSNDPAISAIDVRIANGRPVAVRMV